MADGVSALVDLLQHRVGINLNVVDKPNQIALEQLLPPARALHHSLDEPTFEKHPQRRARCLVRTAQQVDGAAVCFHANDPLQLAKRLLAGRPARRRRHSCLPRLLVVSVYSEPKNDFSSWETQVFCIR